jgi:DNA-binding CsgD family transcriptional regulator
LKKSAVRARIRQLCSLGVPAELLMAQLLPTLRELIPSDSAGFAWVDARGEIRNLYTERLSSPNPPCARTGRDAALRESFLACAEAPDGIVAIRGDGRDAAYEHDVLRPPGTHHALFGLVRQQSAALGQSVMRYVAHGLTARELRMAGDQLAFAYEDSEEEAMLVTDAAGTIRFASDNGLRLLLLATVSEITPASLGSAVGEGAARTIKALCARLEAAARGLEKAPSAITLDSKWGRFVLRGYRLRDGSTREARIGLRIQRQVPMILRFVKAMARQSLSPQQREIALQIALGRSNAEISDRLGVSLNTVAYHVKQLFLRLDVHTRTEAVEKIAWGGVALAS